MLAVMQARIHHLIMDRDNTVDDDNDDDDDAKDDDDDNNESEEALKWQLNNQLICTTFIV